MWKPPVRAFSAAMKAPDPTARVSCGRGASSRSTPSVSGDAIWWRDGRVQAVGRGRRRSRRMVPRGTPLFELPDALVTPGFVDGHTHFAHVGAESPAGAARRCAHSRGGAAPGGGRARRCRDGSWARAGTPTAGTRRRIVRRSIAVQPAPVYLDSLDVHAAWVNSAALAAARDHARDTPDPFGGRIVRDAAGEPTGLLLERAVELMTAASAASRPPIVLDEALREAQAEAHRLGVTGIHDVEGDAALAAVRAPRSRRTRSGCGCCFIRRSPRSRR